MRTNRIFDRLTALALTAALLAVPALATGAGAPGLTLAYTQSAEAFTLRVDGLDGKTNIYAVQLDLVLDGAHPDAKLIPASADVASPDRPAAVAEGKTHLTVYLDAQVPMNDGKTLTLGGLTGVPTLPAQAELILLDRDLEPIAFSGAPSLPVKNAAGGGSSGGDDGANGGGGNSGGGGGGGGGGSGPAQTPAQDRRVSADAKGQAVLKQKDLKQTKTLTVQSGAASVLLPEGAVDALRAAGADVTVRLTAASAQDQEKGLRAQTGGAPVYAVSASTGEKALDLGGGLTLTVPFTGQGTPVSFAVGEGGTLERLNALTAKNGAVTLELPASGSVAVLDVRKNFDDVSGWYEGYVHTLVNRGVMSGMDEHTFAPQKSMTRAELVTTLARVSGGALPQGGGTGFTDVPADAWYAPYVAWAKESGVTSGVSETAFAPAGELTREQLCTMLARFAGHQGAVLSQEQDPADFSDAAQISAYAAEAVALMQRSGIVGGRGDGRFDPQGTATRAECAKMLAVLLQELD